MWREMEVQAEEGRREEAAGRRSVCGEGRGAPCSRARREGIGSVLGGGRERRRVWSSSSWGEAKPQQQRVVREGGKLP